MSRSPRSIVRDVSFPRDLQDGCEIVAKRRYREISNYLFDEKNCPISNQIKSIIEPKSMLPNELERSYHSFESLYQSHYSEFRQRPIFTLLYVARCMSNKVLFEIIINFVTDFLQSLEMKITSDILDIFIPFCIYKQYIQDNPPVIGPFFDFLTQYYEPSRFLPHFLKCITALIENNMIGHFHIDLLIDLYEKVEFSRIDSQKIIQSILDPLEGVETLSLRLACETFKKLIAEKYPDLPIHTREINIFDHFDNAPSPSSQMMNRSLVVLDQLNNLLDDVENHSFNSAIFILSEILNQLNQISTFPSRSPRPLFELAIRTFATSDSNPDLAYSVILALHNICEPVEILKIYLNARNDDSIPLDFLEQCYQLFLKVAYNQITPHPPSSLIEDQMNDQLQQNSNSRTHQYNPELKKAFDMLLQWETAYEAVDLIYKIVEKSPDVYLYDYFDDLEYSQRCYLVQGLHCIQEDKPNPVMAEIIDNLEVYNSKRAPKVTLESSLDFGSPSQSEAQNLVFENVNKSPRSDVSPSPSYSRKRMVSNGVSLKTSSRSNH
ncbi:hypothetical protein TRFO_12687 [Tritrichomonas foetus]|uniref:Uncharacterized protein n=1 Tax=Tritrichomonas foetus TaxID=1144522 RepID=A0A1J4L588_9EUKA|nr:hypothetical protein TRFO_12687 [Tritrichomonas foetus]|eukprot:OHT17156.1 hypothetical protein TRFO_12687 [Tritrichomonas foetus]